MSNQIQDKAHSQAQGQHAQAGAGHAHTSGPHKHNTRVQVRVVCQDKQANKCANKGKVLACRCKARKHKRDMKCKHLGNGTGRVAVAVPYLDCFDCAMVFIIGPGCCLVHGLVCKVVHVQGADVASCRARRLALCISLSARLYLCGAPLSTSQRNKTLKNGEKRPSRAHQCER